MSTIHLQLFGILEASQITLFASFRHFCALFSIKTLKPLSIKGTYNSWCRLHLFLVMRIEHCEAPK